MTAQTAAFCSQCGAKLGPDPKFCGSCGAPVVSTGFTNFTRLRQIFDQAISMEAPARDAWLEKASEGDETLLRELRAMFAGAGSSFLESLKSTEKMPFPPRTSVLETIGCYKILREIGRGGMGVVYLAARDDGTFRKHVALKLLLKEHVNPEFVLRFKQERQVLAALDHPNIARILDGGDAPDGAPYCVMEYVEGLPLDEYCDSQRLSLTARIKIFQQVCTAVDYLHRNSIVHRDLKPSNILVSEEDTVKLLDFGIAKVLGAGSWSSPDLTNVHARPMTPVFASPEQITGAKVQKSSDIYSLGAILYLLLTGRLAYQGLDEKAAKLAAGEGPPPPSSNIREDLRANSTTAQLRRAMMGELDSIVLMSMQIDPKKRYQSAAQFAEDLQHFLDGLPVIAHHTSMAGRSVKLLRRKRTLVAVCAAFLVVSAFGAREWQRSEHQKIEAAARESQLRSLLDQLESQLKITQSAQGRGQPNSPQTTAVKIEDVRKLKAAFANDLGTAAARQRANASEQQTLIERGVRYLDHLWRDSSSNTDLSIEIGDAYQQLGSLQEQTTRADNGGKAIALKIWEKAAAVLVVVAAADPRDENVRDRLASINVRIRALGGATPSINASVAQPTTAQPEEARLLKPAQSASVRTHRETVAAEAPAPMAQDQSVAQSAPAYPAISQAPNQVSADLENRLINVTAKVQSAEQTLEPMSQRLAQDGQTLNADTLARLKLMRATLDKANRDLQAGDTAAATESLSRAEALAKKLLQSVGH